jgi:pimeloyl-ACP methyl ester carboxylesterase
MLTLNRPRSETRRANTPLWRRIVNLFLFFILCMYIVVSPPVLARLIFGLTPARCTPEQFAADMHNYTHEDVWIKLDNGARIFAWYFPGKLGGKAVIVHHGKDQNISCDGFLGTALTMVQAGASVLLYDYEGYGLSEGTASTEAFRRDGEAAYRYMTDVRQFKPTDIVHCGISLGTGVASDVASHHPCAGVLLVSPYLSLSSLSRHVLPFMCLYPSFCFPQPDLGAHEILQTNVPLMILHGVGDPLIPVANADEIYRRASGPKTYFRFPGTGHLGGLIYSSNKKESGPYLLCKQFLDSLPTGSQGQIPNLVVKSSR